MQVAMLTQDYYGFVRQSSVPNKQAGAEQAESKRPRPAVVVPAERLVEGELLKNRSKRAGNPLGDMLQRERFTFDSSQSHDETFNTKTAQRAINAYLDHATTPDLGNTGRSRNVDYYV